MIKKVINFFDHHRILLVILILFILSISFMGIQSYLFLHHHFEALSCTKKKDETYCYHDDIQIFINPKETKETFFKENEEKIKELRTKYKLPKFNFYTAYYYEVASLMNYNETGENEDLLIFFKNYNRSYNLANFYQENVIYYELFYRYKIV